MIETYIPLYRKYRPQSFGDLVGQGMVAKALSNAIAQDQIAHAYLLTGPRGTGKTSSARILAKSLNCEQGPTVTPCQVCASCEGITAGNALDVIEFDAASNNSVDQARELIESCRFAPMAGRYKIYIIDEVHMLSTQAFNALLKTLEEPPPGVVFIFATTEAHKVLPTIVSRCQRFDFNRITTPAIVERVGWVCQQEAIHLAQDAMELVARSAKGGMRDALSLLDQLSVLARGQWAETQQELSQQQVAEFLGLLNEEAVVALTQAIAEENPQHLLVQLDALSQQGIEAQRILQNLTQHLRALLLVKTAGPDLPAAALDITDSYLATLRQQMEAFPVQELPLILQKLGELEMSLRRTQEPQLWLEIGLLGITFRDELATVARLEKRVEALEKALQGGAAPHPARQAQAAPPPQSTPAPAHPAPKAPPSGPPPLAPPPVQTAPSAAVMPPPSPPPSGPPSGPPPLAPDPLSPPPAAPVASTPPAPKPATPSSPTLSNSATSAASPVEPASPPSEPKPQEAVVPVSPASVEAAPLTPPAPLPTPPVPEGPARPEADFGALHQEICQLVASAPTKALLSQHTWLQEVSETRAIFGCTSKGIAMVLEKPDKQTHLQQAVDATLGPGRQLSLVVAPKKPNGGIARPAVSPTIAASTSTPTPPAPSQPTPAPVAPPSAQRAKEPLPAIAVNTTPPASPSFAESPASPAPLSPAPLVSEPPAMPAAAPPNAESAARTLPETSPLNTLGSLEATPLLDSSPAEVIEKAPQPTAVAVMEAPPELETPFIPEETEFDELPPPLEDDQPEDLPPPEFQDTSAEENPEFAPEPVITEISLQLKPDAITPNGWEEVRESISKLFQAEPLKG